jgi:diguanylate cyclase (GGDEF)-like protein/PAS domain S-box-containing protein
MVNGHSSNAYENMERGARMTDGPSHDSRDAAKAGSAGIVGPKMIGPEAIGPDGTPRVPLGRLWRDIATLRGKFLAVLLPAALLCFLVFAGVSSVLSYRDLVREQRSSLAEFAEIQSNILAMSLWNLDHRFVEKHLESFRLYPWVSRVVLLETATGRIFEAGDSGNGHSRLGTEQTTVAVEIVRNGRHFELGRLTVASRRDLLFGPLVENVLREAALAALLALAIVISVLAAFRGAIGRPLERLLAAIRRAESGAGAEPVAWSADDEIGRVIAAYNSLLATLRRKEAALRGGERRYRLLVESMNEGLIVQDPYGRIGFANRRFLEMLDRSPDEVIGSDLSDFLPDFLAEDNRPGSGPNGGGRTFEAALVRRDGSALPVLASMTPAPDEGRSRGAVFVFTDIARRKAAEDRLRRTEEKYRNLFQHMTEGIFQATPEGRFLEINPALAELLDYDTPGDLIRNVPDIGTHLDVTPEQRNRFLNRLESQGYVHGAQFRVRRKDGRTIWVEVSARGVRDDAGRLAVIEGIVTDATERKRSEQEMHRKAYQDALTGIPNRFFFFETLEKAVARAGRFGEAFALLYLDLDRFKEINDTAGHAAGDQVLREAARRIADRIRKSDTVARLGGDEFAVILAPLQNPEAATAIAEDIVDRIRKPFRAGRRIWRLGTSVGIALYPRDAPSAEALVRRADAAMYRAKTGGCGVHSFASPDGRVRRRG